MIAVRLRLLATVISAGGVYCFDTWILLCHHLKNEILKCGEACEQEGSRPVLLYKGSFLAALRNKCPSSARVKTSGGLVSLWQLASHLLAFYF